MINNDDKQFNNIKNKLKSYFNNVFGEGGKEESIGNIKKKHNLEQNIINQLAINGIQNGKDTSERKPLMKLFLDIDRIIDSPKVPTIEYKIRKLNELFKSHLKSSNDIIKYKNQEINFVIPFTEKIIEDKNFIDNKKKELMELSKMFNINNETMQDLIEKADAPHAGAAGARAGSAAEADEKKAAAGEVSAAAEADEKKAAEEKAAAERAAKDAKAAEKKAAEEKKAATEDAAAADGAMGSGEAEKKATEDAAAAVGLQAAVAAAVARAAA